MNDLLEFVIETHGGLTQWQKFSDLVADVEVIGQFCEERGSVGMVPNSKLLLSLRQPRTVVLLPRGKGWLVIEPHLISHVDGRGRQVGSLRRPQETMTQDISLSRWDMFKTAYFVGHTVRHAVTAPFLYSYPGFDIEEVAPWHEDGQTWRTLRITCPKEFEAPAKVQFASYGTDGFLRRTRNAPEMLGGMNLVEYVLSYIQVNGISMPAHRELFNCDSLGNRVGQSMGQLRFLEVFFTD